MMRLLLLAAAFSAPLAAQQNPFKLPKPALRNASVAYALTGDLSGSAQVTLDGDRMVRRATGTVKVLGKTSTTEEWHLTTADSIWHADLTRKQGTVMPNLLPLMARAYDELDGAGKKRLHQNMQEMAAMMGRMFGFGQMGAGEKTTKRTYAGQECEERSFGQFTLCTMEKTPLVLHSKASLVCMAFEETATAVAIGPVSGDAFLPPAGITFSPPRGMAKADSLAEGLVTYLASEALTDSLAQAKAALAKTQQETGGDPAKMTPEQEAEMQAACQAFRDFDMGKAMADIGDQAMKAFAESLKNEAKNAASRGLRGLIKKPRIP